VGLTPPDRWFKGAQQVLSTVSPGMSSLHGSVRSESYDVASRRLLSAIANRLLQPCAPSLLLKVPAVVVVSKPRRSGKFTCYRDSTEGERSWTRQLASRCKALRTFGRVPRSSVTRRSDRPVSTSAEGSNEVGKGSNEAAKGSNKAAKGCNEAASRVPTTSRGNAHA